MTKQPTTSIQAPAIVQCLNGLSDTCHSLSTSAGWWERQVVVNNGATGLLPQHVFYPEKIALIHSEVSEALEGIRKSAMDSHLPHRRAVEVELADALIRIFDLAGAMSLDLGGALVEKLEYNARRADHKREARAAAGGKKF